MKKLMFMLAAVAMAVCARAASVSWSTVAMYNAEGAKIADKATVYVYLMDADTYNGLTDVWAAYGDKVKAGGTDASASKTSGKYTHKASNIYAPNGTATANTTYYAAIIATYGTDDDMKYYAEKAAVTTGDDGDAAFNVGVGHLDTAASAATAWTAAASVPEPTSGLLMLMGLAGLALRRRRA